ncbi:MAG: DUF1614 domain-containing protein [Parcubacteria group bacterium]
MVLFSALIYLVIALVLVHFEVFDLSLAKYGLPGWVVVVSALLILFGSLVDIPLAIRGRGRQKKRDLKSLFFVNGRKKARKGLYLNLGGAIVPTIFSFYLLSQVSLVPALVSLFIVIILARFLSGVSALKGNWLHLSAFIPLLAALGLAFLLVPANPAAVFYIAGTLGALIGAGLLNLDRIGEAPLFIGGRGMFHGIFIVNVVFLLL